MPTRGLFGNRTLSLYLLVLSCAALLLCPRAALAQKKTAPSVAFYGTGPDLKPAREAVERLLPDGVVLDKGRFTRELQKGGPLGPEFDSSPRLGKRVQKALERSKVSAAVLARTYRKKKERLAHVLVFLPGSAEPSVDETITLGKKNTDAEWVELNDAVYPTLSKLEPEPEPEPKAAKSKSKAKAKAAEKDKSAEPADEKPKQKTAKAEPKAKPKKGAAKKAEPEPEPEEEAEAEEEEDEAAKAAEKTDEEEDEDEDEADDEEAKAAEDTAGAEFDRNRALVLFGVAFSGGGRSLAYEGARTATLRDYSVGNMMMLGARLEAYPLARGSGFAKNLGLAARFDWALPFTTKGLDDQEFDGSYTALELGLRYRIPISRSAIGIGFAFGKESFSFSEEGEPYNEIAGVDYTYLRPGLDVRVPAGPIALFAGLGYRLTLSGGTVADNFRDTSLSGLDARLGAALPFGDRFETWLAFRYARYGYSMSPEPADPYVADGATDQFFAVELGGSVGF